MKIKLQTSLGCAGHPIIKTLVIDELASEGVRFSNAFVTDPEYSLILETMRIRSDELKS